MIFGKLLCKWLGHVRAKGKVMPERPAYRLYTCPRCGRVYTRKVVK